MATRCGKGDGCLLTRENQLAVTPEISFRSFVGLREPPEGIAQIGGGADLEGKPFGPGRARFEVDAGLGFGSLQQLRRHGLDLEDELVRSAESPGDWKSREDFLAALKTPHAKHRT